MDAQFAPRIENLNLATAALGAAQTRELRKAADSSARNRVQTFAQEFTKAVAAHEAEVDPGTEVARYRRNNSQDDDVTAREHFLAMWGESLAAPKKDANRDGEQQPPRQQADAREERDVPDTSPESTEPANGFDQYA